MRKFAVIFNMVSDYGTSFVTKVNYDLPLYLDAEEEEYEDDIMFKEYLAAMCEIEHEALQQLYEEYGVEFPLNMFTSEILEID